MAGAVPLTSLGAGFVGQKDEPDISVRKLLGRYFVCRKDPNLHHDWREIIAEVETGEMALVLANYLRGELKTLDYYVNK